MTIVRRNSSPVFHFDDVWFAVAGESRPLGDEHLCAELLRLRVGATDEIPTRDTGGKPQVVFDS